MEAGVLAQQRPSRHRSTRPVQVTFPFRTAVRQLVVALETDEGPASDFADRASDLRFY